MFREIHLKKQGKMNKSNESLLYSISIWCNVLMCNVGGYSNVPKLESALQKGIT